MVAQADCNRCGKPYDLPFYEIKIWKHEGAKGTKGPYTLSTCNQCGEEIMTRKLL